MCVCAPLLTSSHERGGGSTKKSFPSTDHLRWRDRSTGAPKSATAPACRRKSPFRSCPRFSQHRPVPPSTPPTERVRPSVRRMLFLGRVPGAVFDRPVTGEHASLSCRLPSTTAATTATVTVVYRTRRCTRARVCVCSRVRARARTLLPPTVPPSCAQVRSASSSAEMK